MMLNEMTLFEDLLHRAAEGGVWVSLHTDFLAQVRTRLIPAALEAPSPEGKGKPQSPAPLALALWTVSRRRCDHCSHGFLNINQRK